MKRAIGIFDSGIGGLTVMRKIHDLLPHEDLIYFGDTARVPYGNKSPETIKRYSLENALFLMQKDIKMLVIACNSASAVGAGPHLQERLSIPVIEVIGPAVLDALQTTKSGRIAVIGTRATIQSEAYQTALQKALPSAQIFSAACPLLVPITEEQLFSHPASRLIIEEYVAPLKAQNPDVFVLGCTHYPLLKPLFQEILGQGVTLIDPAETCAEAVKASLGHLGLINDRSEEGQHLFFVSDDAPQFKSTGELFLKRALSYVEQV